MEIVTGLCREGIDDGGVLVQSCPHERRRRGGIIARRRTWRGQMSKAELAPSWLERQWFGILRDVENVEVRTQPDYLRHSDADLWALSDARWPNGWILSFCSDRCSPRAPPTRLNPKRASRTALSMRWMVHHTPHWRGGTSDRALN